MADNQRWAPYVPVSVRHANAKREACKLTKKGNSLRPIHIRSKAIATSFWGIAWCNNLEIYADWANRMPRGRTYARNGAIVDLQIDAGTITALVSGSSLYKIKISIETIDAKRWQAIRDDCGRQISSLIDLMRGKLPNVVLTRLTDPNLGMFPSFKELKFKCSCPDYATLCKHIAATLYGVGHLLDSEPGLFFKMRGVNQAELVGDAIATQAAEDTLGFNLQSDLACEDLGAIFGIDLAKTSEERSAASRPPSVQSQQKLSKANKFKTKMLHETDLPNPSIGPEITKKRISKAKLLVDTADKKSNATKVASKVKKKVAPKRKQVEVPQQSKATEKNAKAKAMPGKNVSIPDIVVTRKKRAAVSDKYERASTKPAKR